LKELETPKKEEVDKEDIEYMLSKKDEQPKITPLLQAIRAEKERRAIKKQIKKAKTPSGSGRVIRSFDGSQSQPKPADTNISSGGGSSKRKKKKKAGDAGNPNSSAGGSSNRDPSSSGVGNRSIRDDSSNLPPSPSKSSKKFTLTKKDGSTKTF
jgi:hypothetical protein